MPTADEALSREVERGMTREDLLRRAAALGIVVSAGAAFGPLTEAAFACDPDHVEEARSARRPRAGRPTSSTASTSSRSRTSPAWWSASTLSRTSTREAGSGQPGRGAQGGEGQPVPHPHPRAASSSTTGRRSNIDDVIYSIRRTKNPKLKLFGNARVRCDRHEAASRSSTTAPSGSSSRAPTSRCRRRSPSTSRASSPKGYQPNAVGKGPLQYIGTGPFKVKSFTPGRESVHERNENYWRSGQPYFDQVRIINFPSDAAKVNALLSGQVEAMADVPFAQVPVVRGAGTA